MIPSDVNWGKIACDRSGQHMAFPEFSMEVTSRSIEHQHQSLEGIVTYCDDRLARVWIEAIKCEKEISFAYRSRHFNLGDWLLVSLKTDEIHKIAPLLETRVLEIGVAQVRTEVIFRQCNEKIGHGIIIESKHFNRVAVFTPFTGIIINRIYRVYVERIPRDRQWNEQESDTYWFVPSNQIPELVPVSKNLANDKELIGPLIGVVVSKAIRFAFVWTPSLGEGICENDENLLIGRWIKFMANRICSSSHPRNYGNVNINFCIIKWTMADPILSCVPLSNNLLLISTIFISHWPMNNLFVDWIGPVTDRNRILEKAVCNFGIGQTYEVMLKRLKKSSKEPIATWNVLQILGCVNRGRKGIVCFVDIQKSLALVYIQDAKHGNGRMLHVDLKIFEVIPALGDWFIFEINESSQFWRVKSAMKSRKLCISHIFNGQLEVETEVVLTDKISAKGHRIMFSVVLGPVAVDANRLSNITLNASQKYTVWCTAMRSAVSDDPYWRITNFHTLPMKNRDFITKAVSNTYAEKIGSYVGIVVGECYTGYFIWTPLLAEIICYYKNDLHIGDWIRFCIRRKQRAHPSGKFFCVNRWQKIDSLYPTREENNTAVVTVELMISENYSGRQSLSLPFFGEVLDKKHCFGEHIDDIRGHIIEMDIKRVRTKTCAPSWNIIFVSVKGPLHRKEKSFYAKAVEMNADPAKIDAVAMCSNPSVSNASTQNATTFFDDAFESIISECSCSDFERKNCENHSPTTYNGGKKEHHEDYHGRNDPQKDDVELDPVICSMKLLFMSKEVREAIKINCIEEYTILCQHFDIMP
ncbi:unnamed protein product [Onchocerca flexuosa]|uniref:S1 motif domain-containing protein n=1 Tax=Onchocerca flexuosa TaxID=387005 RepID=A0A183GZK6_9BILA|nr:unnamed protein product [Onchocerca flexuosa]